MKISKVMSMAKRAKMAVFLQREEDIAGETYNRGPQWIQIRGSLYCLAGMPEIRTKEQFFSLCDIKAQQQDHYAVGFQPLPHQITDIERWKGGEQALQTRLSVAFDGRAVQSFQYGEYGECIFVPAEEMAPFAGDTSEYLEYTVRQIDGVRLLCVFEGIDLQAVIGEIRYTSGNQTADEFYTELSRFQQALYDMLNERARAREPEERAGTGGEA